MGLDMFIFRAEKPGLDELKGYEYQKMSDTEYWFIDKGDIDDPTISDLKKLCTLVKATGEYWDLDKVQKHYGFVSMPCWLGCGPDGNRFMDGKQNREIVISNEEQKKFVSERTDDYYAVRLKEVAYWKKEYALQEKIHKAFKRKPIKNCGYYRLTKAQLNMIARYDNRFTFTDEDVGSLFYLERY